MILCGASRRRLIIDVSLFGWGVGGCTNACPHPPVRAPTIKILTTSTTHTWRKAGGGRLAPERALRLRQGARWSRQLSTHPASPSCRQARRTPEDPGCRWILPPGPGSPSAGRAWLHSYTTPGPHPLGEAGRGSCLQSPHCLTLGGAPGLGIHPPTPSRSPSPGSLLIQSPQPHTPRPCHPSCGGPWSQAPPSLTPNPCHPTSDGPFMQIPQPYPPNPDPPSPGGPCCQTPQPHAPSPPSHHWRLSRPQLCPPGPT